VKVVQILFIFAFVFFTYCCYKAAEWQESCDVLCKSRSFAMGHYEEGSYDPPICWCGGPESRLPLPEEP